MKPKKRILSLLLTICLLVGLMPTAVIAADTGKAIQLVDSGTADNISGAQTDNIYFGTYKQSSDGNGGFKTEPVKWRVLSNADGELFLLSDQNLDGKKYHSSYRNITWEKSFIRSWLNGTSSGNFLADAFSGGEQGAIADTYVYNATQSDGISNPNPFYGTPGGADTTDKVFLLSLEEALNTAYGFSSNTSDTKEISGRVSLNTAYAANQGVISYSNESGIWWLRSPGREDNQAAVVYMNGSIPMNTNYVTDGYVAVRPALNLNLKSVLFTSAAAGGKSPGAEGTGTLNSVSDYSGSE